MTENRRWLKTLTLALLCSLLFTACKPADDTNYCDNHYLYHQDHQGQIGMFTANLDAEGHLQITLEVPDQAIATEANGEVDLAALLGQPERVYTIMSETACSAAEVSVENTNRGVRAAYSAECGPDNRVEQISVGLFDNLPPIGEVEATIVTPAAQKHFAISRQCDSAIFRLQDHREEE